MPHTYPLMLDVSQRQAVIVGAGAVGARKASGLIEAGATRVRVVAPTVSGPFPSHPAVEFVREIYRPEHLGGADLVFAATDAPEVNDAVVRDARERGILVCRADSDDEHPGDFITPAKFVESVVTVTVSAGHPALSVLIRNELARLWNNRWGKLATAMETLRPEILSSQWSAEQRRDVFRSLASEEAMRILETDGLDGLRTWVSRSTGTTAE